MDCALALRTAFATQHRARGTGIVCAPSRARWCAGVSQGPRLAGQYVSIRYSERLADVGIEPSVGSTGATTTRWPSR